MSQNLRLKQQKIHTYIYTFPFYFILSELIFPSSAPHSVTQVGVQMAK